MTNTTSPFELSEAPDPSQLHPSDRECPCPDPDDQYLMQIDCGAVYLTHKACGKQPRAWLDDAFGTDEIPVTLHWHHDGPTAAEDDDNSYGTLTINGRAVLYDDVPYLIGRDYADRDGDVWHVADCVDADGHPLIYLLPERAGSSVQLGLIVDDFGPLTLRTTNPKEDTTR